MLPPSLPNSFPKQTVHWLNHPSTAGYRRSLSSNNNQRRHDNYHRPATPVLASEVAHYLNAYAAARSYPQQHEAIATHAASLNRSSSKQADQIAQQVKEILTKSSQQLADGELQFAETMATTEPMLKEGDQAVADELARERLAEMKSRWVRATAIIIFSLVALIVAAILWLANRRRAATMRKAIEQVTARVSSITVETDRLDKLFQRNEDILGSRENLQQRGYVGLTQELAMRALNYVDDLFIMSKK